MSEPREKVIAASMIQRKMGDWKPDKKRYKLTKRSFTYLSAVVLCLSAGTYAMTRDTEQSQSVMSHVTTGFEYDESIGRLQYVSSILPESAMVFLSNSQENVYFTQPAQSEVLHAWTQQEPWIEFDCSDHILACADGDVMTIVRSRDGEYTVRLLHEGSYESVYSGLSAVTVRESESVAGGEIIGEASKQAAFELRKDGLSVLPTFSVSGDAK